MPCPRRATVSGIAYHVLNRRVMRLPIFDKPGDYEAFERVLAEGLRRPDALEVVTRGDHCRLTIFRVAEWAVLPPLHISLRTRTDGHH